MPPKYYATNQTESRRSRWEYQRLQKDTHRAQVSPTPAEKPRPGPQRNSIMAGEQLEALKGKKVVVITHHGISRQSVPDHFMGGPSQPAYTSELTEFVLGHPCRLWIHGHTHWAFDYKIGETRVLANPRGYPHETTHGFNPKLIVEV